VLLGAGRCAVLSLCRALFVQKLGTFDGGKRYRQMCPNDNNVVVRPTVAADFDLVAPLTNPSSAKDVPKKAWGIYHDDVRNVTIYFYRAFQMVDGKREECYLIPTLDFFKKHLGDEGFRNMKNPPSSTIDINGHTVKYLPLDQMPYVLLSRFLLPVLCVRCAYFGRSRVTQ
jgi:hypothetical protein